MSEGLRGAAQGAGIIRSGLSAAWLGPRDIYSFFAHGTRYHFLRYLVILVAVVQLYHAIKALMTQGVIMGVLSLVVMAISIGMGTLFANIVESLGWWFAWYPGLGYRLKDGTFRPILGGSVPGSGPASLSGLGGAAKADETLIRGAAVVDGAALAVQLKRGVDPADLARLVEFGGVPVPFGAEPQHFLIEGATGSGKSQAINGMLRVVRKRQQAAIIADPGAGYLARFGELGETILNPLDGRSAGWSAFVEIREEYDCQMIAKAAIPDAAGEAGEWNFYAQTMLGAALKSQWKAGDFSTHKLLYLMNSAPIKELEPILAGTAAYPMIQKGGEKALASIRMIASVYLAAWEYLPDHGTFSVRDWVRDSDSNPAWLYLTYRDDQMALLRNLIACWLELAIVEGLTLSENANRRLWYIMDELDSLGKVSSLRAGLTKLRKYGGVCVSGLQTIAQLRTTYGKDEAQTLLSSMSNKLVLRAGDNETGKYFENELGEQEVKRAEVSNSTSTRIGELPNNSENVSERRSQQMAVLASEVQGLPDLHGFLKLIGLPIARVVLQYVAMPEQMPPYVAKKKAGEVVT
ncbi:type IV secretion system DNA-binding domain-containing protein [Pseudoduganella danionis]|uniref:Type IV secretion system DNA-binding domain-containing protein n=1 Tax=Pseudoduganella danionis TaxID=1890295 RepID=A0ABW9SV22_9BURK|nr:type IV secretion system DNA-binding domain-containing protein [Pseudoduganella danionis]MTW35496.1 type IV secretion system DNA-binding domain-containing protein [Pseudoduganella danionis]